MIILEEKYGIRNLSDDNIVLLKMVISEDGKFCKDRLTIKDVKRLCILHNVNVGEDSKYELLKLINGYQPQK